MQTREERQADGIGDAAVRAKTGKGWDEWFALLDAAGARDMDHKQIVGCVAQYPGVSGWWQQSVTVAYEKERGLRETHQRPEGYSVSGNKTVAAPPEAVFDAWHGEQTRKLWLPDPRVGIRTATRGKSLRITWVDGKTSVDVTLYPTGAGKTRMGVQHSKLVDSRQAAEMKAYWTAALERLKQLLER